MGQKHRIAVVFHLGDALCCGSAAFKLVPGGFCHIGMAAALLFVVREFFPGILRLDMGIGLVVICLSFFTGDKSVTALFARPGDFTFSGVVRFDCRLAVPSGDKT